MHENTHQLKQYTRVDLQALEAAVQKAVRETPVIDIHSHLYAPEFGELLLWGVDELLTYHYLIAEMFRASDISYEAFWGLDKKGQADHIWQTLFVENSPYSEACRGVLTALKKLGIDVAERDLNAYRQWFQAQSLSTHIDRVFQAGNIASVTMTNDPFDAQESPVWNNYKGDPRFKAALRIDPMLNNWEHAHAHLDEAGYDVTMALTAHTFSEIRRFLSDWITKMDAQYMAVSLPPDFDWPEESYRGKLIAQAVLPVALDHDIPFAMMIGVKRQVNSALQSAGDGVGTAALDPVERLCAAYPKNKFMVTMLARENQHALCVAARKFRNLLVFGCWWFLNNPSLIEEMTRMRFELLGPGVIPQHSDARILEQVLYKWSHSREIIAKVLIEKYRDLLRTGWVVEHKEIERDVKQLLGGNFDRFRALKL